MRLLKITSSIVLLFSSIVTQSSARANQPNSLPVITFNKDIEKSDTEESSEARVLVAEIVVNGVEDNPDLEQLVVQTLKTTAGLPTTVSQIRGDVNNIYATGFFANATATPEDTPLGVRVTYDVVPNPVLTDVRVQALPLEGNRGITPPEVIDAIFGDRYGQIVNLRDFIDGSSKLDQLEAWYQEQGYSLAKVVGIDDPSPNGVVTLVVIEGVIEDIRINFINADNKPVENKTRKFIINRELQSKLGDVFNRNIAADDLQRIFDLGLFQDVQLDFTTGEEDPTKAILNLNVIEARTDTFAFGGGISYQTGLFLTTEYKEKNMRGLSQQVSIEFELGGSQLSLVGATLSPGSGLDSRSASSISELRSLTSTNFQNRRLEPESLKILGKLLANPDVALDIYENIFSESSQNQIYSQDRFLEVVFRTDELKQNNFSSVEKKLQKLIEVAKSKNSLSEQVFGLINLGDYYLRNGEYSFAIETYKKTAVLLEEKDNGLLKLLVYLKLSESYGRAEIWHEEKYILHEILNLLDLLKKKDSFDEVVALEFRQALKKDWVGLPTPESKIFSGYWKPILSLIETITLLDISSTYQRLGDYQQAFYVVNSAQLTENMIFLSDTLPRLIEEDVKIKQFIEQKIIPQSWTTGQKNNFLQVVDESISSFQQETRDLIRDAPALIKLFSENFIYSELDHPYLVISNPDKVNSRLNRIGSLPLKSLRNISIFFEDSNLFNRNEDETVEEFSAAFFSRIFTLLISYLTVENQAVVKEDFKKIVDDLFQYLNEHKISPIDSDDAPVRDPNQDILDTISLFFATDRIEELTLRHIFENLATKENLPEHLSWAKRISMLIQADNYRQKQEFKMSIKTYEAALKLNPLEKSQIEQSFPQLSSFDTFLDIALLGSSVSELQLHNELANLYYKENDFLNSKKYYLKAFSLIEDIALSSIDDELDSSFSQIKPGLISELYYGLSRSELALGNEESAEEYIQAAKNIIDSFYDNTVSQSYRRLLSVDFKYGFGQPGLGLLKGSLNLNTDNSRFALDNFDSNEDKQTTSVFSTIFDFDFSIDESPCYTLSEYFECRQKYYELHVELLLEKHKSNRDSGFDKLAFKIAEDARVRTPQISKNRITGGDEDYLNQRRRALTTPSNLEEIQQKSLDENTVLLSYFLGVEKSYLWLVSKDQPLQTIELPARSVIESKAREFYDLLTEPSGRVRPKTTAKAGQELSALILAPIAEEIAGKRLLVVGDGFLQYLPFSALPHPTFAPETTTSPENTGEYAPHLRPLILDHEIIMLPSASSLVAIRETQANKKEANKELAIFADPVFNHQDERVKDISISSGLKSFSSEDLDSVDILHGAIPGTLEELSSIQAFLPPEEQTLFAGFEASRDNAFNKSLGDFRIVHFATHGIFNSQSPERSGVALSNINNEFELQSGLLSPLDTFNKMELSGTELVVLSGCRTGFGSGQTNREGLTGLTGGFLAAGSDRVVASLWSVQDSATRELMTRFYSLMLDGDNKQSMTPSQALRAAQLSMWEEAQWQTPYFWASFIMQGEWR